MHASAPVFGICNNLSDNLNTRGRVKALKNLVWSEWHILASLDFGIIPFSSGVYQLRWAITGRPQVIHRANGDDDSGLLYIGESTNLRVRIKTFWRAIHGQGGHTAGWTYHYYEFSKKFGPEEIQVRWAKCPEDEVGECEDLLLEEYVARYFDKPPLNLRIPRH
jgi:hypothetical protein